MTAEIPTLKSFRVHQGLSEEKKGCRLRLIVNLVRPVKYVLTRQIKDGKKLPTVLSTIIAQRDILMIPLLVSLVPQDIIVVLSEVKHLKIVPCVTKAFTAWLAKIQESVLRDPSEHRKVPKVLTIVSCTNKAFMRMFTTRNKKQQSPV